MFPSLALAVISSSNYSYGYHPSSLGSELGTSSVAGSSGSTQSRPVKATGARVRDAKDLQGKNALGSTPSGRKATR